MKKTTFLALAVTAFFAGTAPAHAEFMIDSDPGGEKLFIDKANKDANSFSGTVGSNNSGPLVGITTIGLVDTGSGYANIKPVKDGTLTSLTFTPNDATLFGDFSFRGQLVKDTTDNITLTVQDNQGGAPQTFTFLASDLGTSNDFLRQGIIAVPGSNETIKSITLEGSFKEVKQIDFSNAVRAVPEPETYALLGLGLAVVGIAVRRRAGLI